MAAIFVAVPILLMLQLQNADERRAAILRDIMTREGQIIAESLRPLLGPLDPSRSQQLSAVLERLASGRVRVRLLFLGLSATSALDFVAAMPPVPQGQLDNERRVFGGNADLNAAARSCAAPRPIITPLTNVAGGDELLTSVTPVKAESGCWLVLTSAPRDQLIGSLFSAPYWQAPEVRFAVLLYVAMAALVLAIFVGIWNDLRGFSPLSRYVRTYRGEAPFALRNHVPELAPVAEEFDLLVRELRNSAEGVRLGAEDNVHALKGPIGVIAQSLEPLRAVARDADKPRKAVERIEKSVARLDALVTAVRKMDIATAESIGGKREPISLPRFLQEFTNNYRIQMSPLAPRVELKVSRRPVVRADPQHLETALENILDNAVAHTPEGKAIVLECGTEGDEATIAIVDQGSGVPDEQVGRLLERYFSLRPVDDTGSAPQFGVGLWIARRNIESMNGTLTAENESRGGLRITVRLPLA